MKYYSSVVTAKLINRLAHLHDVFPSELAGRLTRVQQRIGPRCLYPSHLTLGFHHPAAVLPLPFRRSILPFRCAVVTFLCTAAVLPFRSYLCRCAREAELLETSFRIRNYEVTRTLIGLSLIHI